ncbi:hypothetical protein MSAN_00070900 [Mycena sanguinolenta]|uniref:F-box domain-containing protein n=1 Tax=Mycena sanguinolenta TaxID=230812 RepID=A0A8H6ZF43_9AGAR|nr:hypothetical protein MSAN_00070900 [Mycena sanguinolenta]
MAACKRALEIPEIVRIICGEEVALVRLATTSKIFTEPALDLIWSDQTSLVPLIKCTPETLWETRGQGAGSIIHLRRPIISADLPRLLFYSARVRNLTLRDSSNYIFGTVHPDFLRALDMSMPVQCFPKLSEFSWFPKKKDVFSIMRHFLGHRIRKIDLQLDDRAMLSIIPFAKGSCPLVSNFSFSAPAERVSLALVTTVSDAVCGWQNLTCLAVPDLDKIAFMHVAELPLLTDLSLTFVEATSRHLQSVGLPFWTYFPRPPIPVRLLQNSPLLYECHSGRFLPPAHQSDNPHNGGLDNIGVAGAAHHHARLFGPGRT